MQFYPAEWLAGSAVQSMLCEQIGGFMMLLAQAWIQKPPCSLPGDLNQLAALSKLGTQWSKPAGRGKPAPGPFVREQFTACTDGRIRNAKQVNVWFRQLDLRHKRASTKKGGLSEQTSEFCLDKITRLLTPSGVGVDSGFDSGSGVGVGVPTGLEEKERATTGAYARGAEREDRKPTTARLDRLREQRRQFLARPNVKALEIADPDLFVREFQEQIGYTPSGLQDLLGEAP